MGNVREPFEPETIYHVYNHGNTGDIIFKEDKNYDFFLKKYRKYISNIADTYAYCPTIFIFWLGLETRKISR